MNKIIEVEILYPGERSFKFNYIPKRDTISETLEDIFAEWNAGSTCECELFLQSKCRSLSTNDFVKINNQWFLCNPIGWKEVNETFVNEVNTRISEKINSDKSKSAWAHLYFFMNSLDSN